MKFRSNLEALILSVLAEAPKHGYEIAKRIRELSDDSFKYGEAQLYPALKNLEEEGSIMGQWDIQEGKPNRRVYEITPSGQKKFEEQKKEWNAFANHVNRFMLNPNEVRG